MWQNNMDEGSQWRVIGQFMRLLGNMAGHGPKAIGPASPDEPIKLRIKVRGQDTKFVFPAPQDDNIGVLKTKIGTLIGGTVTKIWDGEYILFDSLKISHVLKPDDEIEVEVGGILEKEQNQKPHHQGASQGGIGKRPPEREEKHEHQKPGKQHSNSGYREPHHTKTEAPESPKNSLPPSHHFNHPGPKESAMKEESIDDNQAFRKNSLISESGQKKKRGRPKKDKTDPSQQTQEGRDDDLIKKASHQSSGLSQDVKPDRKQSNKDTVTHKNTSDNQHHVSSGKEGMNVENTGKDGQLKQKKLETNQKEDHASKKHEAKDKTAQGEHSKKHQEHHKEAKSNGQISKQGNSKDAMELDGFLVGLGAEKVTNFNKPAEKEKPSKKKNRKNDSDDQKIKGLIGILENSSEDEPQEKHVTKKADQNKQNTKQEPNQIHAKEHHAKLEKAATQEPERQEQPPAVHKKSLDLSQKQPNKAAAPTKNEESSDSDSDKVKKINTKSNRTGKQSTETLFKSVLSGGSEMNRILKHEENGKRKISKEQGSEDELSPLKAPKVSAKLQIEVPAIKKDESTKVPASKAPVNKLAHLNDQESSESDDSDLVVKKPIKVFKKQPIDTKMKGSSESESESDRVDQKKQSSSYHKYDHKNNIFKNNRLTQPN